MPKFGEQKLVYIVVYIGRTFTSVNYQQQCSQEFTTFGSKGKQNNVYNLQAITKYVKGYKNP